MDFETIGQNSRRAPALDCAYTTFVWDRFLDEPYSFNELTSSINRIKLSIEDQVKNYDFSYKEEDLNFWMQQPPEVRKNIKPRSDDATVGEFINALVEYLRHSDKIEYWWSRSNTFDPIVLDHLSESIKQNFLVGEYLKFWRVRDIRTFIDAKFNFTTRNGFVPVTDEEWWNNNFNAHDSIHDVAADILRLQAIHRAENDMKQVER
jgi:hypothetical protein